MSGSGYSRQSSASIIPTAVVRASPINAEFDKLRDAFTQHDTGVTGHRHDGSSDEGSYVPFIADLDKKNHLSVDQSNNRFGVFVEVGGSATEQVRIQDGAIVPVTDNDIDLGASGTEFKDLFIDGTATIDTLTVDESATITANLTVNGNTTLGDAATDTVTFTADVASPLIPSADDTHDLGAVGAEWRNLHIDGIANIDSLVADTADIDGGTIDGAVIGGNATAAASFTTMAASSNATVGGTFAVTNATTLSSSLDVTGATGIDGDFDINTNKFTVASSSGNTAIAGTLGVTGATTLSDSLAVTGAVTANAGVNVDNITIDGTEIDLSSGDLTVDVAGDIILDADGGDVTLKDDGTTYANLKNSSGELVIQSGSTPTTAVTFSGANADFAGTLDVTGVATLDSNLSVAGNATITGNLTVNGSTTTIDTVNTTVKDALIELGTGTTGTPSNDAGIVIERGSENNAFIGFDESADKFTVGTGTFTGASTGDLTITTGTMVANLEGNVTGNIDGIVGQSNPAAGSFTTLQASNTITGNLSGDVTSSGTIQFANLSDGTITVTAFVDEDNMASNSATLIPTQQSVKAYVDSVAGSANNVTGLNASGAEINAVADVSAITIDTSTAIAADDGIAIFDASANSGSGGIGYFDVDLLDTYFSNTIKTLTQKTLTSPTITSPTVTGLHLNDSGFTVEGSSDDGNDTTVSFTNPTAARTITIPDATGTVALLSSAQDFTAQQTFSAGMDIDNGQFIGWGGGSSRPAITGDKSSNKMEFYVGGNERLDLTTTDLTSSLTGSFKVPVGTTAQRTSSAANGMFRYNSDNDAFEGYAGGAWGAIGGGGDSQTASTSSTAQTAIATYTASSSLGIEITVVATDTVATERTITKLLVTHDGSTAVATQYGEVNTATAIASYDVDINSGNVRLLATAASSNATNFSVNAVVLA